MTSEEFYPVVGRSDTGKVALRLPIEELKEKDEQFSLFVLSLLMIQGRLKPEFRDSLQLQNVPSTQAAANFYNIAGIHGKPFFKWPGDPKDGITSRYDANDDKDTLPIPPRFGGYCNHGSVLFPTWHRPYVLLIEQSIGQQATLIAVKFDEIEGGTRWAEAAAELRFPYWDWAEAKVGVEGLPSVLHEDTVYITVPNEGGGEGNVKVDNPLAFFRIEPIPPDFDSVKNDDGTVKSYFKDWDLSLRHPVSKKGANSRIEHLQRELKERSPDVRRKVAALFTFDSNMDPSRAWDEFSNRSPATISINSTLYHGSLEGVHDNMHDIIGGNGHMGHPDYAAFDPIFFLHHCNVDRLFALWEYCHRNENNGEGYWMGDGYECGKKACAWTQPRGTYAAVYNAQLLPSSALAPFRMKDKRYWTTQEARYLDDASIYPKHYTYETDGIRVDRGATEDVRIASRGKLQKYYGYRPHPVSGPLIKSLSLASSDPDRINNYHQFAVVVELLEHANNGPYSFKLFGKTSSYNTTTSCIGAVSVFARHGSSPCEGCQGRRAQGTIVLGIIFIDDDFVERVIRGSKPKDLDGLAKAIKNSLRAELQDARGLQLSITIDPNQANGEPPEDIIRPRGVTLVSTGAARYDHPHETPYRLVDWATYGHIFEKNEWRLDQQA